MSLATGYQWSHKGTRLLGYSMAGISTSIVFPEAEVCFDVAQGLPFQIPVPNILLTHGHMDHASGIPYLIAQKSMMSQAPPVIYMPEGLVAPLTKIMKLWEEIDNHTYRYHFKVARPGEEIALRAPFFFKTFPTYHRVDSQGYTIFERKKHLKAEYKDAKPHELGQLRKNGTQLDEFTDEAVLSFTGDTKIEFLDSPQVRQSRILIMEVTYWDRKKSVENAREWGHIHIDELLPRLADLSCEKIVLIHASARYSTKYLREIIDARVPEHLKSKVDLFPRPI